MDLLHFFWYPKSKFGTLLLSYLDDSSNNNVKVTLDWHLQDLYAFQE